MIKVQAVQELEKCQGVLVVVQLLALARPMSLQMQAAAILQASTFSPLPYCFLKRFRGFGVLTSSALCIASNVLKVLKYFDSKGNSDLLPCLIGFVVHTNQAWHRWKTICRTTHMSAQAPSFRWTIVHLSILMYSKRSVASVAPYDPCAC